ncbi:MAG: hypothetical protein A3F69_00265 [Acidobacteria bacterium RIFCSPLOWO2_12_FULL_66_10]|nr:MAG: hypothetical protein A3F69_00265 [Acidobacteria bacterium RIFCSPLOWO2_12_FULL_66_10]
MNPVVFKIAHVVVPPIARVICAPAGYAGIASIESDNKISTIETVEFTNLFLGKDASVAELIDKIRGLEPFRALWLAEGLGQVLGNRAMARGENPRDLLSRGEGAQVPESMQLMVHAGLCLAFGRYHFDKIGKNPTAAQIRDATIRIAELARLNLLPGYAGIGYEAWGMVTQFFYRPLFATVTQTMEEIDPEHAPFLWHGAGRASYFIDFMPRWNEPWPGFPLIDRMVTSGTSRLNLIAGLASGMMIVNMKTPVILEAIVKERVSRLFSGDVAAFAQGVACGMVMRQDTSPNEEHALNFVRHVPAPGVAALFEKIVAGPARLALEKLHPKLKAEHSLDQVCCYRPLDELLAD